MASPTLEEALQVYLGLGLKDSHSAPPQVLSIISSLVESCVEENEKLFHKDTITIFDGLRAPSLSIRQYIGRIFKYSSCSPSCFVVAHIYIQRFLPRAALHLTCLNVHRILITSVMIAAKYVDDAFFNNAYYARVGGVSTAEMNRLEINFLFSLDFRLHVTVDTFWRHCLHLEKEATGGYQVERPIEVCRLKEGWKNVEEATCTVNIQRLSCGIV